MMTMGLFPTKLDGDQDFGLLLWKDFVPFRQLPKTEPGCRCGHDDLTLLAGCGNNSCFVTSADRMTLSC